MESFWWVLTVSPNGDNSNTLAAEVNIADAKRCVHSNWPCFYDFTNKKLHFSIVLKFCEVSNTIINQYHCCLFEDLQWSKRYLCFMWCVCCFLFLQLLNHLSFLQLKQLLKLSGKIASGTYFEPPQAQCWFVWYRAQSRAEQEVFTLRTIVWAFEQTGIWPFNLEQISKRYITEPWFEGKGIKGRSYTGNKAFNAVYSCLSSQKPAGKQELTRVQTPTLLMPFEFLAAKNLTNL